MGGAKPWVSDPDDLNWNPAPITYLLGDLGKLLDFSGSQSPHLQTGGDKICLMGPLQGFDDIKHVRHLGHSRCLLKVTSPPS